MSAVLITAVGLVAAGMGLAAWTALAGAGRTRQQTMANLHRGFRTTAAHAPGPAASAGGGLAALPRRLTPRASARRLERLLARAGRPPAWPLERLLAVKLLLGLAAGALSILYLTARPGALATLVALVVTGCAYFLPELLLHSRAQERNEEITLELADTLDQMTIAVEAGLGFDSAMARAGKNGRGALAQELIRTLQDIQLGQSRREAYEALGMRTDVPDLRRFIRAVVQADTYGIAIADVLRTQAADMRLKRRQRAEEKAMQVPVKVIFPLIMCILPVLFIVLLGPAVMDMMAAFSG